jgi:hypothetical protein
MMNFRVSLELDDLDLAKSILVMLGDKEDMRSYFIEEKDLDFTLEDSVGRYIKHCLKFDPHSSIKNLVECHFSKQLKDLDNNDIVLMSGVYLGRLKYSHNTNNW